MAQLEEVEVTVRIKEASNKKMLQRLLGMFHYLHKFKSA